MKNKGQIFIEYALLLGVVAMAFTAMYTYVERAARAHLNNIGYQIEAQPETRIGLWPFWVRGDY